MSNPRYPTKPDEAAFSRAGSPNSNPLGGLTKREYFAACALTGAMADPHAPMACFVAAQCVAVADMLIESLNAEASQ